MGELLLLLLLLLLFIEIPSQRIAAKVIRGVPLEPLGSFTEIDRGGWLQRSKGGGNLLG